MSKGLVAKLMSRWYSQRGEDALDAAFCAHARPGMRVLDAGCGGARGCSRRSPWQQMHIVGVDQDPAVKENPFCNDRVVCDVTALPFADSSFDIIHCRWLLEHLADPLQALREFARVLKPGGRLLALTPNTRHYATIAARLTPLWFHRWWLNGEPEPFRVYYRANSPRALHKLCEKTGLKIERLELIEGPPHYLVRFAPAFVCGLLYERLVNSSEHLGFLRQRILLEAVLLPRR